MPIGCTIENLKRLSTHSHMVRVPEDVVVSSQILDEKYKWLVVLVDVVALTQSQIPNEKYKWCTMRSTNG